MDIPDDDHLGLFETAADGFSELEASAAEILEEREEAGTASRKRKSRDEDEEGEGPNGLGIHMCITQEERDWAIALREAALREEGTKDIPLRDMELVQHAIVGRGNIAMALERIHKLHLFRKAYQIEDTAEHGVECIRNFMELQPGFHLNMDLCPRQKHYVHVVDFAKFHPKKVRFDRDWKVFLSGIYYFMTALHPTLSAVRNGVLVIMEGDGMGWDNFCIDFERRLWHEHGTAYPFRLHEFSWVHTPLVGNVFYSLLKPILPEEVREVVHLGVKFDESFDGRLDSLFLQPSVEIANQRQLKTIQSFLEARYHNQAHFHL